MLKKIKKWFKRHIDYRIVGEYYDTNGDGHYYKKYIRKYYWKGGAACKWIKNIIKIIKQSF